MKPPAAQKRADVEDLAAREHLVVVGEDVPQAHSEKLADLALSIDRRLMESRFDFGPRGLGGGRTRMLLQRSDVPVGPHDFLVDLLNGRMER